MSTKKMDVYSAVPELMQSAPGVAIAASVAAFGFGLLFGRERTKTNKLQKELREARKAKQQKRRQRVPRLNLTPLSPGNASTHPNDEEQESEDEYSEPEMVSIHTSRRLELEQEVASLKDKVQFKQEEEDAVLQSHEDELATLHLELQSLADGLKEDLLTARGEISNSEHTMYHNNTTTTSNKSYTSSLASTPYALSAAPSRDLSPIRSAWNTTTPNVSKNEPRRSMTPTSRSSSGFITENEELFTCSLSLPSSGLQTPQGCPDSPTKLDSVLDSMFEDDITSALWLSGSGLTDVEEDALVGGGSDSGRRAARCLEETMLRALSAPLPAEDTSAGIFEVSENKNFTATNNNVLSRTRSSPSVPRLDLSMARGVSIEEPQVTPTLKCNSNNNESSGPVVRPLPKVPKLKLSMPQSARGAASDAAPPTFSARGGVPARSGVTTARNRTNRQSRSPSPLSARGAPVNTIQQGFKTPDRDLSPVGSPLSKINNSGSYTARGRIPSPPPPVLSPGTSPERVMATPRLLQMQVDAGLKPTKLAVPNHGRSSSLADSIVTTPPKRQG